MNTKSLIRLIDAYAAKTGLAPSTIGRQAVGNARLYDRLKDSMEYQADLDKRLREWFREAKK